MEGLYILRQSARSDFIEPKNVLDREMREAVHKLKRAGDKTERRDASSRIISTKAGFRRGSLP